MTVNTVKPDVALIWINLPVGARATQSSSPLPPDFTAAVYLP